MSFANVGSADRMIRFLLGIVFVTLPFLAQAFAPSNALGIACFLAAAIMFITATVKFCPIYGVLRLRTSPKN